MTDTFLDRTVGAVVMRPLSRWPGYFAGSDGVIYSTKKSDTFEPIAAYLGGRKRCQYLRVTLYRSTRRGTVKKNFDVHFLIATAWLGRRRRRAAQAAHNDGNRENNAPTNLAWRTKRSNEADKRAAGTDPRGERNGQAKANESVVRAIRASDMTTKTLAESYGLSVRTVQRIRSRQAWAHVSP